MLTLKLTYGQFLIHLTIGTTIYTTLVKRNHSVTMVLPMVERLRNWPLIVTIT